MNNGFILPKWAYWLISWTWGFVMTAVGALGTLLFRLFRFGNLERQSYGYTTIIPGSFGGVSFGPFSFINENPSQHLREHEFGHSIQNCIFGPLFIPYIAIPSFLRYWIREIKPSKVPYDYAWFEGQATLFGERYSNINKEED